MPTKITLFLLLSLVFLACQPDKAENKTWRLKKTDFALEIAAGFYKTAPACRGIFEEEGEELLYFADFQTKKELIFANMQGELLSKVPLAQYSEENPERYRGFSMGLLVKNRDSILIVHPSGRLMYINRAGELQKESKLQELLPPNPLGSYFYVLSSFGSYFDGDVLYIYRHFLYEQAPKVGENYLLAYGKAQRASSDFLRIEEPFGAFRVEEIQSKILERQVPDNHLSPSLIFYDYKAGKLCLSPSFSNSPECIDASGAIASFELEGLQKGTYPVDTALAQEELAKLNVQMQEKESILFLRYDPWRKLYYMLSYLQKSRQERLSVFDKDQKLLSSQLYGSEEKIKLSDMLLSRKGILLKSNAPEFPGFSDTVLRYQLYDFD